MVGRHMRSRTDAVGSTRTVELSEFPVTVSSCFDDRSFTLFRYGVVLLCGLVMLWLRSFAYGPLEWLWCSLTYWHAQPFRLPQNSL
jgi:Protein of unknown function (DUF418)